MDDATTNVYYALCIKSCFFLFRLWNFPWLMLKERAHTHSHYVWFQICWKIVLMCVCDWASMYEWGGGSDDAAPCILTTRRRRPRKVAWRTRYGGIIVHSGFVVVADILVTLHVENTSFWFHIKWKLKPPPRYENRYSSVLWFFAAFRSLKTSFVVIIKRYLSLLKLSLARSQLHSRFTFSFSPCWRLYLNSFGTMFPKLYALAAGLSQSAPYFPVELFGIGDRKRQNEVVSFNRAKVCPNIFTCFSLISQIRSRSRCSFKLCYIIILFTDHKLAMLQSLLG